MAVDAKYVRVLSPAGKTVNFTAITGNSHRYYWLTSDLIKTMLDKKIRVFEKLKAVDASGKTEIELTKKNFDSNNNGKEYDATSGEIVIKDLEKERALELKKYQEEFLEELGFAIAEQLEANVTNYKEKKRVPIVVDAEEEVDDTSDDDADDTVDEPAINP